MAVLGIDDTDSRSGGMCTTWIATEVVERLPAVGQVYLVRLNPAIEHKTRGNAAVGVISSCSQERLRRVAVDVIDQFAVCEDPETNPGLVTISEEDAMIEEVRTFARNAVRNHQTRARARDVLASVHGDWHTWGNGRGLIGALAATGAVGADRSGSRMDPVFGDWTYERIAYREADQWGTERSVEIDLTATEETEVWDTIDPVTQEPVCVPHSPCPVLYGIRGEHPGAIANVVSAIDGETVERWQVFRTNQGTDAHLRPGDLHALEDGRAYRVKGTVAKAPKTQEGGHVRVPLQHGETVRPCMAFAPTGRFRDHVRALRPGDVIIACGEVSRGAIKLEKFALLQRSLTEKTNPVCPSCGRSMASAGRDQGYRCRPCGTDRPGRVRAAMDRGLERGWYEVPPGARRHLAKPLSRGTYALPIHPTTST